MSNVPFPYVEGFALSAFERLEAPLAIFSFGSRSLVWANASAVACWDARSFDDLKRKVDGSFREALATMLDEALPALREGMRSDHPGPLYATPARLSCTGISVDRHPEALLAEIRVDTDSIAGPAELTVPVARARSGAEYVRPGHLSSTSDVMLDGLLGVAPIPALVLSASGTVVLKANSAARKSLQGAKVNAEPADDLFVSTETRATFFDELARRGSCTGSAQLVARGGIPFAAVIAGCRLRIGIKEVILLMFHDIDDLHRTSAELETALNLQRNICHNQLLMLEIASHEFRTPLAVIDGAAQRIARRATDGTPDQIIALTDRIRATAGKLGGLLASTVDRARSNRAGIVCRPKQGQLQRVIAQATMAFGHRADFEIAEAFAQLPEIWFDQALIEQVFTNLIENSIKYSTGRARIRFSAVVSADSLAILVRDWGIGIAPDEHQQVFAEGKRGTNVGLREGSGLGLYIVNAIIRAHGGEIRFVRTQGAGTTVKIDLPIRQATQQCADDGIQDA